MPKIRTVALVGGVAAAVLVTILVVSAFNGAKNPNESALMPNAVNNTQTTIVDTKNQSNNDTASQDQPVGNDNSSAVKQDFSSPKVQRIRLVEDSFNIGAGGYATYSSVIPKGAVNVQLSGNFSSDGEGIKVLVGDETAYTQWKEGKRGFAEDVFYTSKDYSNSGSVALPEGGSKWSGTGQSIFLIFDNTGDSSSRKQVSATFDLSYLL